MTDTSNDFDWATDDSVAVQAQPALAVYANKFDQVVIRRERDWNEEEDCFIQISKENVLGIVRAILEAGGYEHAHLYEQRPGGCCYDIDWPEGPFSRREVAMMNARPDIDWQAVNEAADAAGLSDERDDPEEAPADEPRPLPLCERRAKAKAALLADQKRSNRSVAAECGLSDKTVAAIRLRMELGPQDGDGAESAAALPAVRISTASSDESDAESADDNAEFRREDNQFRLVAAE